ncbi:hypothetical protein LPJ81_003381 [Coemansia sp. IMI 209127]|nr:hypothetical protein LPJ81_003381 [Coemansia sp. IMI 209127]
MPKRKLAAVDYEASVPDDTVEESGELPDEYTPADGITLTPLPTAPISVDINLATVNLRSLLKKVNTLMLQLATSETNIAFVQEANLTAALCMGFYS